MRERELNTLSIEQIIVSEGRGLDSEMVASIASSIEQLGLQNPISVFADDNGEFRVISGRHRLAAMRSLGRDRIDALVYRGLSEIEIRLAEITENLHRAELTKLQRSEQIAEYAKLAKERREHGAAQLGQHLSNEKGASGRERGNSAAACDLGVTRQEVQRSEKIARITPEAKAAAKKAGLDDNQSALLQVGSAPKEQQEKVVTELALKKEKKRLASRSGDASESRLDNDNNSQDPAKNANEAASGNDTNQRHPRKDVYETVNAILRNFEAFDVKLIIKALSGALEENSAKSRIDALRNVETASDSRTMEPFQEVEDEVVQPTNTPEVDDARACAECRQDSSSVDEVDLSEIFDDEFHRIHAEICREEDQKLWESQASGAEKLRMQQMEEAMNGEWLTE